MQGMVPLTVTVSSSDLKVMFVSGGSESYSSSVSFVLPSGAEIDVKIGFEAEQMKTSGSITAVVSIPGTPVSRSFLAEVSVTGLPASSGHGTAARQDANVSLLVLSTSALVSVLLAVILIRRAHGRTHIDRKKSEISAGRGGARRRGKTGNRSEQIKPRRNWER
jgi:hypothetical protein